MLRFILVLCGVIHLLPVSAVLGQAQIVSLYGVEVEDSNMLLLLQHRAILFALIGIFMITSVWRQRYLTTACFTAVFSMSSFVILVLVNNPVNTLIQRVMWIDVALLVPLSLTWVVWRIYRTDG
ncbi:hypothetical protein [Marinicella sp. W31]|uniref:hypothetical protein n=1 Tax=Marinicella sp. W31 TaxID=3023713 RepID=UPI0037571E75